MIGLIDAVGSLVLVVGDMPDDLGGLTALQLPADFDPMLVNYNVVNCVAVANIEPTVLLIKAEAERRILDVAQLWQQINDLYNPTDAGAIARRAAVNAIRQWSNDQEALARTHGAASAWPAVGG